MVELMIVGLLTGLLSLSVWLSPATLLGMGLWCTEWGFLIGVPSGVVYHVQLYRALRSYGEVPGGWIWHPTSLNRDLAPEDQPRVLPWCYAGAASFGVVALGLVMVVTALVRGADVLRLL